MQTENEDGQTTLFDLAYSHGKMCLEPSLRDFRAERTSALSWKKSAALRAIPFQSLDLTPGYGNLLGESYWEILSPSRGALSMLNTGVSPNEERESSLSQILQADAPLKYYLSRRSCRGILRRASVRGRPLPPKLEQALRIQAGIDPRANQKPRSPNPNDQGRNHFARSEESSGMQPAQEHGHKQSVYENHGLDARYTGPLSVAPTLSAGYGEGGNNVPLVASDNDPIYCISGNAIDRQPHNGGSGIGYQEKIAYTLTTADRHAVLTQHRFGYFKPTEVAGTECARLNTTDLICQSANEDLTENNAGQDEESQPAAYLIRRLTPGECELLQGFPPGWTALPGASDSARYKAIGNSVAIPCFEYVLHGIALVMQNQKQTESEDI